ncbi:MAG: hypothetical protein M9907_06185 [Burkholderiaceae bacterium]|nr:hypothetical protein [Burkholderiaceae bacterium]
MSTLTRTARAIDLLECAICGVEPVATLAEYWPHRLTPAGKQRVYRYGLCAECFAEVKDEATQQAALAAIERYFERHDAECRPPWERR